MLMLHLAFAVLTLQSPGRPESPPPPCVGFNVLIFESGSAAITPSSAAILDNFIVLLGLSVVPSRVTVTGHTDRVGSDEANLRLSRRRASAVRAYLVSRGVPSRMITNDAQGERRPLAETPDETPERHNRNVQIVEHVDPAEMERREAIWARIGRPTIIC